MPRPDVSFFFPEHEVGGAQYLFARMAKYLIDQGNYQVTVVDYDDGFMERELWDRPHRLVRYDPGKPTVLDWPTTLVLSLSYIPFIGTEIVLRESTGLFLWDLHPYNLVEQMALSGFYKRFSGMRAGQMCALFEPTRRAKLANLVETALTHNGMAFMAKRNYAYNRALLGFTAGPSYLPLPLEAAALRGPVPRKRRCCADQTVHVGWLSRLAPEKLPALYRLIVDVQGYQADSTHGKIHLHIIGDGPDLQTVKARSQGLAVTFPGRLQDSALSNYMLEHLDVGFAMGTSALEFSARGVPSVLTSAGLPQDDLKEARAYRWLSDSEGFDVTAEERSMSPRLRTFDEVLAEVRDPHLARQRGEACRTYTLTHHELAGVGAQFAAQLALCRFTYLDLKRVGMADRTLFERALFGLKSSYKMLRASSQKRIPAGPPQGPGSK